MNTPKKRKCQFCEEKISYIDYKDVKRIINFTSGLARIAPRYYTGVCLHHQKKLARAIKRARFMGLLAFIR
ncbi:30S ribosomal protein S18 [Candidatus Peregrinibacteria bacterium]|nr:30S ribosomal protein S18 [Candidatus Peregrinibacteria bacterium]